MTEDSTLQFEKAEIEAPTAVTCVACNLPIAEEYFEVNGHIVCPNCKAQVEQGQANAPGGVPPALLLGSVAAALGAGVWFAIVKLTGYEIGLIAIGVGVVVGKAVSQGSGGRGGAAYQALAVLLTYAAMVAYYVPGAIEALQQEGDSASALRVVFAIALSFAAPFLAGIKNVIGIAILGFALYEAWKLNKRPVVVVNGPFRLRASA